MRRAHLDANLNPMRWPWVIALTCAPVMSQCSTMHHSREQWQQKATQRGERERYQRKQNARLRAERDRATQARKETQARRRQRAAPRRGRATMPKVDVVSVALQLLFVARRGCRAVSRVLTLLAVARGLQTAPCPQTLITWGIRLALVRIDAAHPLRGFPLRQAPCSHGLIGRLALRIGLGPGKILAVWAIDAPPHQLCSRAPALRHAHGLGVTVAASWTGDASAAGLDRLIAQMGRPAASRTDAGSERPKAIDGREARGLASPCSADLAHAAASMRKRSDPHHPACARFVSGCGRVSGQLQHPLLACCQLPTIFILEPLEVC